MGETIIINIKIRPNGFQPIALNTSPCKRDNTDLVDPQEGQGIFVKYLKIQTASFSTVPRKYE